MFPFSDRAVLRLGEESLLSRVINAGKIAEKLNARMFGLWGCASIMEDGLYAAAKRLKIPLTNGIALTAWSVFEASYRIFQQRQRNLGESVVLILGADDTVGSACARKFAQYAAKVILSGNSDAKISKLRDELEKEGSAAVRIEKDPRYVAAEADLIIASLSVTAIPFDLAKLKQGAVICDVSCVRLFRVVAGNMDGNFVVEAGFIKVPMSVKIGLSPKIILPAALAETILLTLEERFTNYFLSDNINPEKLEEIADIAVQHGFEVWVPQAPLT